MFLSYASQDADAARRVWEALRCGRARGRAVALNEMDGYRIATCVD
jgi:hypothetical protein